MIVRKSLAFRLTVPILEYYQISFFLYLCNSNAWGSATPRDERSSWAAPIRPCLKAKRAEKVRGQLRPRASRESHAAACRVRYERQLFSSVYSGGRAAPVESGQPMSWERFLRPTRSREVPRRRRRRQCTPGSVAAADQPGGSVGRLMIRRRDRGDRTSWTRHAKGIRTRDYHPEYRKRERGTMRLQDAALLCAVLTIVAGRRAFAISATLKSTFLSVNVPVPKDRSVRVRVGEPRVEEII